MRSVLYLSVTVTRIENTLRFDRFEYRRYAICHLSNLSFKFPRTRCILAHLGMLRRASTGILRARGKRRYRFRGGQAPDFLLVRRYRDGQSWRRSLRRYFRISSVRGVHRCIRIRYNANQRFIAIRLLLRIIKSFHFI